MKEALGLSVNEDVSTLWDQDGHGHRMRDQCSTHVYSFVGSLTSNLY